MHAPSSNARRMKRLVALGLIQDSRPSQRPLDGFGTKDPAGARTKWSKIESWIGDRADKKGIMVVPTLVNLLFITKANFLVQQRRFRQ